MAYSDARLSRAIADAVLAAVEQSGRSMREVSLALDRPPDWLWKVKTRRHVLAVSDMIRIAHALGISGAELVADVERRLQR